VDPGFQVRGGGELKKIAPSGGGDVIAKMDIATLPREYARKTSEKKDGQGSFAMKVMYYTLNKQN
jgi:hypothetical protein